MCRRPRGESNLSGRKLLRFNSAALPGANKHRNLSNLSFIPTLRTEHLFQVKTLGEGLQAEEPMKRGAIPDTAKCNGINLLTVRIRHIVPSLEPATPPAVLLLPLLSCGQTRLEASPPVPPEARSATIPASRYSRQTAAAAALSRGGRRCDCCGYPASCSGPGWNSGDASPRGGDVVLSGKIKPNKIAPWGRGARWWGRLSIEGEKKYCSCASRLCR